MRNHDEYMSEINVTKVLADICNDIMLVGIVLIDQRKAMLKDYAELGKIKLRTSVANSLGR